MSPVILFWGSLFLLIGQYIHITLRINLKWLILLALPVVFATALLGDILKSLLLIPILLLAKFMFPMMWTSDSGILLGMTGGVLEEAFRGIVGYQILKRLPDKADKQAEYPGCSICSCQSAEDLSMAMAVFYGGYESIRLLISAYPGWAEDFANMAHNNPDLLTGLFILMAALIRFFFHFYLFRLSLLSLSCGKRWYFVAAILIHACFNLAVGISGDLTSGWPKYGLICLSSLAATLAALYLSHRLRLAEQTPVHRPPRTMK